MELVEKDAGVGMWPGCERLCNFSEVEKRSRAEGGAVRVIQEAAVKAGRVYQWC